MSRRKEIAWVTAGILRGIAINGPAIQAATLSAISQTTLSPLNKNADGSFNIPQDGSQYVPQVGDVIRCNDGTNCTITNVSRECGEMERRGATSA